MRTINASDFKARCLAILDDVARTGDPVTILKRGSPVAQLVSPPPAGHRYPQQALAGTVRILGDLVEPAVAPEEWDALGPACR